MNASSDQSEEERSRSSSFRRAGPTPPGSRAAGWQFLGAGVLATVLAAGLIRLGEIFAVAGAKPLTELLLAVILLKLYPEPHVASWTLKRAAALLLLGCSLAIFWVVVFAWGRTRFPDLAAGSEVAVLVGLSSSIVTAPIFEEKVVRNLLLRGGAILATPWLSAVVVSAVFSLVHRNAVAWSFILSMVLCWLALSKNIGTLQRAVVHGAVNAIVMAWYLTSGFGFF